MNPTELSIYISTPFSLNKSLSSCQIPMGTAEERERYLRSVRREFKIRSKGLRNWQLRSIYVGGGSATVLQPDELSRFLLELRRSFPGGETAEITLSAAPITVQSPSLSSLGMCGLNRIFLEVLSVSDRLLKVLGAAHNAETVEDSFFMLEAFRCPAIDSLLLYGLPGQTKRDLQDALMVCTALPACGHITLKPWGASDMPLREQQELLDFATDWLESKGFVSYGSDLLARAGAFCEYRQGHAEGQACLGLGLGAISELDGLYWQNPMDMQAYLSCYKD